MPGRLIATALGGGAVVAVVAFLVADRILHGLGEPMPVGGLIVTVLTAIGCGVLRARSVIARGPGPRVVRWDDWGVTEHVQDGVRTAIPWSGARWVLSTARSQVREVVGQRVRGGKVTRHVRYRTVTRVDHQLFQIIASDGHAITLGTGALPAWAAGSVVDPGELQWLVRACQDRLQRATELALDPRDATLPMAPFWQQPHELGLALAALSLALVLTEKRYAVAGAALLSAIAYGFATWDRTQRWSELRDEDRRLAGARRVAVAPQKPAEGLATIVDESGATERVQIGEGHTDARLASREGAEVLVTAPPRKLAAGYRGAGGRELASILESGQSADERSRTARLLLRESVVFALVATAVLLFGFLALFGRET